MPKMSLFHDEIILNLVTPHKLGAVQIFADGGIASVKLEGLLDPS